MNKKTIKTEEKVVVNVLEGVKLPPKKGRSHKVIIKAENLWKSFLIGKNRHMVLKGIDLCLYTGEFAIIFGPSGCGKSTLLHTILGLEKPDKGRVFLRERSLYRLGEDEKLDWRREKIGIVFQQSNWIKSLNVLENVCYPLYLSSLGEKEIEERGKKMLELVGMAKAQKQNPSELSGGEQQKVALARALVTDPGIIVADEPTGNLDSKSSGELIGLLARLNREERRAVVMVTHDAGFLPVANRRVFMKDGEVIRDEHD